jgi:penicillin-binding protein 1A
MSDWIFKRGGKNRIFSWLDVDSWIDSSLYAAWQGFKARWNAVSDWFASRFRLTGKTKIAADIVSDAATLGVGGCLVVLVLAIPAFKEIDEGKWLETGQYSVTFLDRYGNEIGKRGIRHDDAVPLEELPDYLIKATLATEDRRFFDHFGIDPVGTLRAFIENMRTGETVQGGSSITQQLAKNLFLTSERSLQRKIKEAFLALWLESRLSKPEILKLYLDRAYMGGGAFGVEAAAQFYFGKSAREVTLAEAAMMAGLFKAPTKFAPHVNLPNARARADDVLTNLVDAGFMSEAQVHGARNNPAKSIDTRLTDTPDYFLDWAFEEIQRKMAGKQEYTLIAKTTVDLQLQKAADDAINGVLRSGGRAGRVRNGAMVAMELDGAVRAMVGGQDYGESQFNRAAHARRQPGSSFKTYVYLTAVESGRYHPMTMVSDSSQSCGNWSPKNYGGGYGGAGSMPMKTALAKSYNTTAVDLSLKVGRDKVLANTVKLGINGVQRSCSMALGDTGITPLEHTQGYAHFASMGKRVKAYAFTEVKNSKGDVVYLRERDEPPPEQIYDRRHIEMMNVMLHEVVVAGTGKRAILDFTATAGKTGTSTAYRDAWFLGFTGKYVAGVWMGNDDFNRTMNNITGGSLPTEAWANFMKVAHRPTDEIAIIPGLHYTPAHLEHIRVVADQRRQEQLGQLQQAQAQAALAAAAQMGPPAPAGAGAAAAASRASAMPAEAREAFRRLAMAFRSATGEPPAAQAAPTASPAAPAASPAPPPAAAPPRATGRERRVEGDAPEARPTTGAARSAARENAALRAAPAQ